MIDSINKLSNNMINLENQLNNPNENNPNNINSNINYSLIEKNIKENLILNGYNADGIAITMINNSYNYILNELT